jgi:toxin ParE1/3/4
VSELHAKCQSFDQRSKRFPVIRTVRRAAIRKLTRRDYLIFYIVGADSVDILRILHGARHWLPLLGEQDEP